MNDILGIIAAIIAILSAIYGLIRYIPNIRLFISKGFGLESKKKKFFKVTGNSEYWEWQLNVIKRLYPDIKLPKVLNKEYPVICLKSSKTNSDYPFKELATLSEIQPALIDQKNIDSEQQDFKFIIAEKLSGAGSEHIGYTLKNIDLNKHGEVKSFTAGTCKFIDFVLTSQILEYELFNLYLKKGKKILSAPIDKLFKELEFRKKINEHYRIDQVINTGNNRYSLLSVEVLMIIKTEDSGYRFFVIKRSDKVSYMQKRYQLIPSGYFDMFETDTAPSAIQNNFDPSKAVFRELIEEVFGQENWISNINGNPVQNIINHPVISEILGLLKNNNVIFRFLGIMLDLIILRHALAFALIIDETEFSKKEFKANFESSRNLKILSLDQLKDDINNDEYLYPFSAGVLQLAVNDEEISKYLN